MCAQVTVFLPTYDGLPLVRQTVATLLAQDTPDFEVLALDDGSTDGTAEALVALAEPRLVVERFDHGGLVASWNRALERARSPFFAIAHQDDLYDPEFLGTLVGLLDANPAAFVAHCRARTIDAAGEPLDAPAERYKRAFWPREEPYERGGAAEVSALLRGCYLMAPTVVFRTAVVREIGPFDLAYRQAPDWEYWLRGVLAGHSVVGTRRELVSYRRHAAMATVRSEADFSRYREEVRLLRDATAEAFRRGLLPRAAADFGIVRRLLLSDLGRRLRAGDTAGARALLAFARREVPGFAGSVLATFGAAACVLGTVGGGALRLAERGAVALAAQQR
jgi:glycosyltransferase involved in cell wall biosynthesis